MRRTLLSADRAPSEIQLHVDETILDADAAARFEDAVKATVTPRQLGGLASAIGPLPTHEETKQEKQGRWASEDASALARAQCIELPEGSRWREFGGTELEPLLSYTTLIDVRWLVRFARMEVMPELQGVVPAWQQLPLDAEVQLQQLRCAEIFPGLPVGVLSYGWAAKEHPDPTGEQLQRLLPMLEAIVKECDGGDWGDGISWGIVWDFMSLPQRGYTSGFDPDHDDRTPEQIERFRRGLANINVWYGAQFTHTLVLDTPMPRGAQNSAAIERRGWCIFERCLSALVKHSTCHLELSKYQAGPKSSTWLDLCGRCAADRKPPIAPDAFEQMLVEGVAAEQISPGSGIKFTSGKDLTDVVIPQYRSGFLHLFKKADLLEFSGLRWGSDGFTQVAASLRYTAEHCPPLALEFLCAVDCQINDVGAQELAYTLRDLHHAFPSLENVYLFDNDIQDVGMQALASMLREVPSTSLPALKELSIFMNKSSWRSCLDVKAAAVQRSVDCDIRERPKRLSFWKRLVRVFWCCHSTDPADESSGEPNETRSAGQGGWAGHVSEWASAQASDAPAPDIVVATEESA